MKGKSMSRAATAPFVRHTSSRAVAGTRHGRGAKRPAVEIDTGRKTHESRAKALRPCRACKKPRTGAVPASYPSFSPPLIPQAPIVDLEELHDDPDPSPLTPTPTRESGFGHSTLGGEIRPAFAPSLQSSYEGLVHTSKNRDGVPSRKRRSDWEDETEQNSTDSVHQASPAKRSRTSESSSKISIVPEGTSDGPNAPRAVESPTTASLTVSRVPEDDRWPTPTIAEAELDISRLSTDTETHPSSSDGFTLRSHLSRWQAPRSSPLGPCPGLYHRSSKISPSPTSLSPNFPKDFLIRNMVNDNITRNPYHQSPQWCEDLHAMGLAELYHPTYTCPHEYHPSDPEYDEEWSNETFSDEEWSDNEDTLPSPADEDQTEAGVTIVGSQEQPQGSNSETFTFAGWSHWHPPLPFPSHMPGIHPPLVFPWGTAESAGTEAKEEHSSVFSGTAEPLPTA